MPAHQHLLTTQPPANQLSVMQYNSGATNIKGRITLQQNLFSFLLEGEKTVYYAGTQAKINPGQFMLLSAGNCLMSEKTAAESGVYRSILLFFDNSILADFFTRHPSVVSAVSTTEQPFLVFQKDAFLVNFTQSLSSMLDAPKPMPVNMWLVKLEELLLYLCEMCPGQMQKLKSISGETADEQVIKQAVTANMGSQVSVEELAFLCNTSLSTFKRRFAKIYGTSPNKWLLERRMQRAAQLLKTGGHKASEIYFDLGYENLSSFIQSFKQVYGVTPKQYQLAD